MPLLLLHILALRKSQCNRDSPWKFPTVLINLKVNGKEVTPFLNSLYKNKHTISFSNFYHQVGLGRTSDAENMLETGTYGISDGSLFTSLGSENTFQAAPQILRQDGYTSAVFHGNVGTFGTEMMSIKHGLQLFLRQKLLLYTA